MNDPTLTSTLPTVPEPEAPSYSNGLGSPKGNTTRRHLLETAWGLFASEGYGETTLRRISQEAGVSLGLSYRYFATKEELVLALYHQILQDLEARAAELPAGSLAERFEVLMRAKLDLVAPHRRTLGTVLSHMLAPDHPLAALGEQTEAVRARGKAVFARAVLGADDAPVDAVQSERLARCLYLVHLGLVMLSFLARDDRQVLTNRALSLVTDLLGFAAALLDSPLAGLFAPRIDGLVDPLLNLTDGDQQVLSERILRLIFRHRRLAEGTDEACATAPCTACMALHLPRIQFFVLRKQPIHMILPAFPAKSPNAAKVLGELPDLGEELALVALQGLCNEIADIYPPGARLTICADGRVFGDLVGVGDEAVSRYGKTIDQWIEKLGLTSLERFSLEDLYDGQEYGEARRQLVASYAEPIEALKARTAEQPSQQALFNGIHRFLYEDRLGTVDMSPSQLRKQTKAIAWDLIQRSNAWTRLLGQCFPQALRLSIHPQSPHADKIGIGLTRGEDAWITPWHGVAVLGEDGYRLMKRSSAEALGARLIRRGRRPSHYSLVAEDALAMPQVAPEAAL